MRGQGESLSPAGGGGRFSGEPRASSSWHTGADGLRWRWPGQPRGGGLPRRRPGVQVPRVLLCFHCWQTATLCCGSVGDLYGFSCTRGYKPCRKLLYLSRCLPWELPGSVPSPSVFLTANLSQVTITAPRQRLDGLWHFKTHGSFPGSLWNKLTHIMPAQLPTHCSIFFSFIFSLHFDWFFAEENYPSWELEEMQRME